MKSLSTVKVGISVSIIHFILFTEVVPNKIPSSNATFFAFSDGKTGTLVVTSG